MNEMIGLFSLITILILLGLILWLFPDYYIDSFRQKMFILRDQLFDDARNGKIGFNDPSYMMLRSSMNGFIQFGHKLNIWQAILLTFFVKKAEIPTTFSNKLEETTAKNTAAQKQLIKFYYVRMNYNVIRYLIMSSPALVATIVVPLVAYILLKLNFEKFMKCSRNYLDKIDAAAYAHGKTA